MTSNRPYLLRAVYEWLVDNDCTPHLVVGADEPGVVVPQPYAKDGQIVLNVSPTAAQGLQLGNELVSFNARFGGAPMQVSFPPSAVRGIYARENGQGMLFPPEEDIAEDTPQGDEAAPGQEAPKPPRPGGGRSHLKVVK